MPSSNNATNIAMRAPTNSMVKDGFDASGFDQAASLVAFKMKRQKSGRRIYFNPNGSESAKSVR